jgi:hypothetical protein
MHAYACTMGIWSTVLILLVNSPPSRSLSLSTTTQPSISINFRPTRVECRQVYQQYPVTLARRLFSSVPHREYAVNNVSFCLSSEQAH